MRALLICTVYPPEVAPAGVMTKELAEDMTAKGHDVTVLTGWPNHPAGKLFKGWRRRWYAVQRQGNYDVIRVWHSVPDRDKFLSRIMYWMSFAGSSFFALLFGRKYDVVYAHSTPIFGPFLTAIACRLRRTAFVYGIYDVYPEAAAEIGVLSRGWLYYVCRTVDTWSCRQARAIPTLSLGMQSTLSRRGIAPGKIPVIPFWLDSGKVNPQSRNNAWRRANNIDAGRFVVLYAGTMGSISGAEMMLDVAARLQDEPRVLFLFVGAGTAKEQLAEEAARRDLTNMRFLPFQPAEQLAEMQATADVGVITLLPNAGRNSIPSKVLGYLAAGRMVVASVDLDSDTANCIRSGGCGLAVPPQDSEAMATAIREAMKPGVAELMGEAARQHFLAHYSREAGTVAYMELLQRTTSGGRTNKKMGTTPLGREIEMIPPRPLKRAVDLLFAVMGLAVSAPVVLAVTVAVKCTSKGPVLFVDKRLGHGGRVYSMYKFRTMKVNAPAIMTEDNKLIVSKYDPRLTPIGRWLRALKLDELPQLFNVLKGDMSLVGPRSGQPKWEKVYSSHAYERLRARPGLTGLGAVVGGRHLHNDSFYKAESRYVQRQSLWLDVLIILSTPIYILAGERIPRRILRRYLKGLELKALEKEEDDFDVQGVSEQ